MSPLQADAGRPASREADAARRATNTVNLSGVPNPHCVRIYEAIDYDYARNFGRPDDSHPMRSKRWPARPQARPAPRGSAGSSR